MFVIANQSTCIVFDRRHLASPPPRRHRHRHRRGLYMEARRGEARRSVSFVAARKKAQV